MNSTKLFGTDGIRARAGEFPLNSLAIVAIGRAIGEKLGGKIFIGQDTRMKDADAGDDVRGVHILPIVGVVALDEEMVFALVVPDRFGF